MNTFVDERNILNSVSPSEDCDVVIAAGAWGPRFLEHYFNNIQRNHKLCLDQLNQKYEYVFYTTRGDYSRYKDRFIIPNITFLFKETGRLMGGPQMDYAYMRQRPLIYMASDCLHTVNLLPNLLGKYGHYDACCSSCQRVCTQILTLIQEREKEIPYESIFNPREFLKLCLPMLYPTDVQYFVDKYSAQGNGVFWPIRREGVLVGEILRAFHWGVFYIKNPILGLGGRGIDSNSFIGKISTPDTMGMITDSDDGFCVDVSMDTNAIHWQNTAPPTITQELITHLVNYRQSVLGDGIIDINEFLMGHNVAIHSVPLNDEWLDLAEEINEFITNTYNGEIKNNSLAWEMLP
jgi:hypothetical protein